MRTVESTKGTVVISLRPEQAAELASILDRASAAQHVTGPAESSRAHLLGLLIERAATCAAEGKALPPLQPAR